MIPAAVKEVSTYLYHINRGYMYLIPLLPMSATNSMIPSHERLQPS